MSTDLVLHRGARTVTLEELDRVEAPPPTETWFPLKHSVVLDKVTDTLADAGFQTRKATLALSQDNARFFGTIDLESTITTGVHLAVGVRNSIDKSLPIAMCAGDRVFCCDNLAFRSEILVVRKHTKFGEIRFSEAICQAVGSLAQFRDSEAVRIKHFQHKQVSEILAESVILRAYERKIISHHVLPGVLDEWRKPKFQEFEDRTFWSLENAFTGAVAGIHKSNPQRFAALTISLQALLSEAAGPAPDVHLALPA